MHCCDKDHTSHFLQVTCLFHALRCLGPLVCFLFQCRWYCIFESSSHDAFGNNWLIRSLLDCFVALAQALLPKTGGFSLIRAVCGNGMSVAILLECSVLSVFVWCSPYCIMLESSYFRMVHFINVP